MRAALWDGTTLRFQTDYPAPAMPGMVVVKVLKAGICETDLQLVQGYMGFQGILGHEFVGIAEEGCYAGRRVVGEINAPCGRCALCQADLGNHCPQRTVLGILNHDGAFADYVCLPEANLHPLPDNLSDDEAVFVEPLAAAFQIPAQIDLARFSQIVILGDGRLGNLCAQVLHLSGSKVTVVGKHASKLNLLHKLGMETILLDQLTPHKMADCVVDCTGSPTGLETALKLVLPRGTIVLKTTTAAQSGPHMAPFVIDELTMVGSRCGPFPPAIKALAQGHVSVTPLISARYDLSQINIAMEHASKPDVLKVLLDIG